MLTSAIFIGFPLASIHANNIAVSNVIVSKQNTSYGLNNIKNYTYVQFDLNWNNSWRTNTNSTNNWDDPWVFIKYRKAVGQWQHAKINVIVNSNGVCTPIPFIGIFQLLVKTSKFLEEM